MPEPICSDTELLTALNSRENLFAFLRNKLSWVIDPEDTFAYPDSEAAGRAVARADLSQIVPFSAGDPFVIFLVEFKEKFRRGDLREILRGVRKRIKEEAAYRNADLDELVFVCTVPDGLRFVQFEERANRQPKLRMFGFDRESVGETFTLRTVNLPLLRLTTNLLGEVDWAACRKNWQDAWNVEKVTKQFFRDYREVFTEVEAKYVHNAPGNTRLFVQRFFNRLMFLHFLSKKGWLCAPGKTKADPGREYLHDLWKTYQARDRRSDAPGDTFYGRHLSLLFFAALNQPYLSRDNGLLLALVGDVPYLNGGLFEQTDDDKSNFTIDDDAFTTIWDRLFSCYNFTVAESTPDDQDVAVDPEMLGKVFEELVTGRHESGSYYTPRPIVQFMCREALKGYLAPCGSGIEQFVDFHDAGEITNHEAVLSALRTVKVVDPACGSGAYLLGMLQELMALRLALFNAKRLDEESAYSRKLEIIQNNIYGVDLDPFAVNTARLRLWLSLVVENERNPLESGISVALPNLDFKIEQGDSISCPDPSGGLQLDMFRENDLRELAARQRQHGDVRYQGDKPALKREIDALARTIKRESKLDETAFDWRVDFGGVFQRTEAVSDLGGAMNLGGTLAPPAEPGGFNIVLANPPYVRSELIKDLKPVLRRIYGDRFGGTMDLYCFFYFRAIELLKDGGQLVFITPNKWFRAGYGEKLRATIAEKCRVRSITDFGDLPVFESATAYPMIFIAQKGQSVDVVAWLAEPKSLDAPYPDVRAVVRQVGHALPPTAFQNADWNLANTTTSDRIEKMRSSGVPLGEYVKSKIYYGVKTGFNTAFVIDDVKRAELIAADPESAEIIKPLATGRDVKRWCVSQKKQFLIFSRRGTDINRYPAILRHLEQWKISLTPKAVGAEHGRKPGTYKWYEIQDEVAYFKEFESGKIIYPVMVNSPNFTYDKNGILTNDKCFIISTDNIFLVGLLNSSIVWEFLTAISSPLRGGFYEMRSPYIRQVPVPATTPSDRAAIATLVQKCLDRRGQDVAELEAEINARVAALYGL